MDRVLCIGGAVDEQWAMGWMSKAVIRSISFGLAIRSCLVLPSEVVVLFLTLPCDSVSSPWSFCCLADGVSRLCFKCIKE